MRALADDDPVQSPRARERLRGHCVIPETVLLETEWVLRSAYHWPNKTIAAAFLAIADLPNVVTRPAALRWAIERYAAGADFADMLHIATSNEAEAFVTFDRRIGKHAGTSPPILIETLR